MSATEPDTRRRERQPFAAFRLTRTVTVQTIAVSVVAFFVFAYCFGWVRAAIGGHSFEPIVVPAATPPTVFGWLLLSIGIVALVVVPHELLHGMVMARYGGTPSYGVGVSKFLLPYAYAETTATSYTRNQLLCALLAPLIGITAIGLVVMTIVPSVWLVVLLAANAAGSIADLRMAALLVAYPRDIHVGPLPTDGQGFAIYGSGASVPDRRFETGSSIVAGSVATLVVGTFSVGVLVFQSLAIGTGDVLLAGDGWLLFRHEVDADGSAQLELGGRLVAAVTVVGGLVWATVGRVRQLITS